MTCFGDFVFSGRHTIALDISHAFLYNKKEEGQVVPSADCPLKRKEGAALSDAIQPDAQALLQCAESLFPIAVMCLGTKISGREAVTEAIAAAMRSAPDAIPEAALAHLIRICQTRTPEPPDPDMIPDVLLPVMKLPSGSRRDLTLWLCGISDAKAAAACGHTVEEQQHKTEKALRQLTFSQGGTAPQKDILTAAVSQLQWTASDTEAFTQSIAEAAAARTTEQAQTNVREIVQTQKPNKKTGRSVSVPLWTIIAGFCCLICLFAAVLFLMLNRKPQSAALPQNTESADPPQQQLDALPSDYLTLDAVQQIAADSVQAAAPVFLSTKLKTDAEPPIYTVTLQDGGQQSELQIEAVSGKLLASDTFPAEMQFSIENWKPVSEMRQAALDCANLRQALILKEKRDMEGNSGCYKYELLGEDGRIYSVQLEAETGALIKYTVDDPPAAAPPGNILPEEAAIRQALKRAGDLKTDEVIVTKVKLDENVYLIAFTLDDGTQYLIELDAQTGMSNTVDVHPVSADTTHAAGLLAARDTALEKAGLRNTADVTFTKAKIDRSSGAYVYELDFETADYEYEVILNTETCEILKYHAFVK